MASWAVGLPEWAVPPATRLLDDADGLPVPPYIGDVGLANVVRQLDCYLAKLQAWHMQIEEFPKLSGRQVDIFDLLMTAAPRSLP